MTELVFPELDDDDPQAPGVVATWFYDDGAAVPAGALLAEVQVSKISGEITAPDGGVLRHKVVEGAEVAQGAVIAELE